MNKFIGIKQGTAEWLKTRQNKLTATNVASVLNMNVFESKEALISKKVDCVDTVLNNNAVNHGIFFENVAKNIYEKRTSHKIFTPGLIIHDKYNWLAASPDGIINNSHLVEFKCYYSKQITDCIPINYWIQMQIQMEVCNYNKCDFVECIFKKYKNKHEYKNDSIYTKGIHEGIYWKLYDLKIRSVNRDKNWFNSNLNDLQLTWDHINELKKTGKNKRKRESDEIDLNSFFYYKQVDTYIQNDLIIYYLELNSQYKKDISSFHLQNKERTYIFINEIISRLENIKVITNLYEKTTYEKFEQTLTEIKNKKHTIIGGVLFDLDKQIYCKYNILELGKNIDSKLLPDQYYPIQIVNRHISILKKTNQPGNDIHNKKYKTRAIMLCDVLNKYQTNPISTSYVLDSHFLKTNKYIEFNYIDSDKSIVKDCLSLYNLIKNNLDKVDLCNISNSYIKLVPNMKNQNPFWMTEKNKIAQIINPVTLIWNCSMDIQNNMLKHSIYSYKNINTTCNESLNKNRISIKQKQIINKIININKQTSIIVSPTKVLNIDNWKNKQSIEFFVDFETTTLLNSTKVLYLIGLGVQINNKFEFYSFCIDVNKSDAEKYLVLDWLYKMEEIVNLNKPSKPIKFNTPITTWHWSHAEKTILNNIFKKYPEIKTKIYWKDLQDIFLEEQIVIKNCYNYKLKSIVSALHSHNLIKSNYNNLECNNGIDAMVDGYQCYEMALRMNIPIENYLSDRNIIEYNKLDCSSLFDILQYLRTFYS